MSLFQRATRAQLKARVVLCGTPGSGKTASALMMAHALGKRIAVIDTERGSARKYVGMFQSDWLPSGFQFDVCELQTFAPATYVAAIVDANRAGYDALVIDSLTHAWAGAEGALEQVDRAAGKSGNSFAAWRDVTPQHNKLVDALMGCSAHLLATMRSKMSYELVEVTKPNGRTVKEPQRVGMAPIQREGMEYEFDLVGDMDASHVLRVTKSRCPTIALGSEHPTPGREFALQLQEWLDLGERAEGPRFSPKYPDTELQGRLMETADAADVMKYIEWCESIIDDAKRPPAAKEAATAARDAAERVYNQMSERAMAVAQAVKQPTEGAN